MPTHPAACCLDSEPTPYDEGLPENQEDWKGGKFDQADCKRNPKVAVLLEFTVAQKTVTERFPKICFHGLFPVVSVGKVPLLDRSCPEQGVDYSETEGNR